MILAIFDLQVTPMLPIKLEINCRRSRLLKLDRCGTMDIDGSQ